MIVVSGEALMDVFAAGDTPTGVRLDARIGGSPLNVALGLARLGQPVAFFGALSSGFLGDRLFAALQTEGVVTDCTLRNAGPATLGLVGVDARGVPSYAFYGERAADRQVPLAALERVPQRAAAYHFGSYAMVVEPVAGTQRALVEREHRRSVIAYDPNVRLNVEPDLQRWRDTLAWMLPRTHLLKVSDEDLALLFPHTDARSWFAGNPELIHSTAFRNGSLQGAYLILGARALGLDCGPMSGFDNAKVDAAFFPGGKVKSNFLVNLGYGDPSKVRPRGPRLAFEEACQLA